MADQVRVFVSHHHSPEEDTFTARLVADLEAAGPDVWVDIVGVAQRISSNAVTRRLGVRAWRSSTAKDLTSETKIQLVSFAFIPQ
jgi:hypothetical protein